jgi:5-methylcytosine-specific restriction endonuclease McrA
VYWLCECVCGKTCTPSQRHLKNGDAKSCSCKQFDRSGFRAFDPKMTNLIRVYDHYTDTDLRIEEFYDIITQNCHYCGSPPSNKFNEHWYKTKSSKEEIEEADILYNGLDKIDPNGDHSRNNVVPCCFPCNVGKSNKSVQEFVK